MNIKERIQRFRGDEIKRGELLSLLNNPVFVEASTLILLDCYPAVSPNPTGAEDTKTNLALTYMHRAGLGAFMQALLSMTEGESNGLQVELDPWGTLSKEKPKRARRKPDPNG